ALDSLNESIADDNVGANVFTLGDRTGSSDNYDGKLDEVRIETVERSADWIKLCYETQKDGAQVVVTTVDIVEFLPLTIVRNATDEAAGTDTCMLYTDNWTMVFREAAGSGGGIAWLSDSLPGTKTNQIANNLFSIQAGGSNSYAVAGAITLLDSTGFSARVRQTIEVASHEYVIDYTVHGSGKIFVRVSTQAGGGYDPPSGLEFRIGSSAGSSTNYKEDASAGSCDYILHSNEA
ncbi:unnamed protein product, partial [marine sediment metagenome]